MGLDAKTARGRFMKQKQELEALQDLSEAERRPVALDQQAVGRLSRMDALQVQAMAEAQARQRRATLGRIEAALGRIAVGEYGFCQECGEEIATKRLEIDPTATHCVTCASTLSR